MKKLALYLLLLLCTLLNVKSQTQTTIPPSDSTTPGATENQLGVTDQPTSSPTSSIPTISPTKSLIPIPTISPTIAPTVAAGSIANIEITQNEFILYISVALVIICCCICLWVGLLVCIYCQYQDKKTNKVNLEMYRRQLSRQRLQSKSANVPINTHDLDEEDGDIDTTTNADAEEDIETGHTYNKKGKKSRKKSKLKQKHRKKNSLHHKRSADYDNGDNDKHSRKHSRKQSKKHSRNKRIRSKKKKKSSDHNDNKKNKNKNNKQIQLQQINVNKSSSPSLPSAKISPPSLIPKWDSPGISGISGSSGNDPQLQLISGTEGNSDNTHGVNIKSAYKQKRKIRGLGFNSEELYDDDLIPSIEQTPQIKTAGGGGRGSGSGSGGVGVKGDDISDNKSIKSKSGITPHLPHMTPRSDGDDMIDDIHKNSMDHDGDGDGDNEIKENLKDDLEDSHSSSTLTLNTINPTDNGDDVNDNNSNNTKGGHQQLLSPTNTNTTISNISLFAGDGRTQSGNNSSVHRSSQTLNEKEGGSKDQSMILKPYDDNLEFEPVVVVNANANKDQQGLQQGLQQGPKSRSASSVTYNQLKSHKQIKHIYPSAHAVADNLSLKDDNSNNINPNQSQSSLGHRESVYTLDGHRRNTLLTQMSDHTKISEGNNNTTIIKNEFEYQQHGINKYIPDINDDDLSDLVSNDDDHKSHQIDQNIIKKRIKKKIQSKFQKKSKRNVKDVSLPPIVDNNDNNNNIEIDIDIDTDDDDDVIKDLHTITTPRGPIVISIQTFTKTSSNAVDDKLLTNDDQNQQASSFHKPSLNSSSNYHTQPIHLPSHRPPSPLQIQQQQFSPQFINTSVPSQTLPSNFPKNSIIPLTAQQSAPFIVDESKRKKKKKSINILHSSGIKAPPRFDRPNK